MDAKDRIIAATPNWQRKTFTLRVYTWPHGRTPMVKYRTCQMDETDFCKAYLEQWDWGEFLDSKNVMDKEVKNE